MTGELPGHAKLARALDDMQTTVANMADLLGVTERTMYRWLAGRHRIPKAVLTVLDMMEKQHDPR